MSSVTSASSAAPATSGPSLVTDGDAKAMLKEYNNLPMPNQSLSDAEIKQYIKYFHWIDAQPVGAAKAAGGH